MTHFHIEERVAQLLQHLGLHDAHFAARLDTDWTELVMHRPDLIASLTLIYPWGIDTGLLHPLASRLLVVDSDGPIAAQVRTDLPSVTCTSVPDYTANYGTEDILADRPEAIGGAIHDFLTRMEAERPSTTTRPLPQGSGEYAGITYHVRGSGPPLVLLPLIFAPSQWEPLLDTLSAQFCTITLSGAHVGMVAMLEARGQSDYLRVVRTTLEDVAFRPEGRVLEVGCGSGVLSRWLVRRTTRANLITGMDINRYLLREAEALAAREGVGDVIDFREGNAEHLPFEDNRFQVTMASTVLEEGDADRMLAEMVRVTETGGYVVIIVRAVDMPWLVNLRVGSELKAKVEAPVGSVAHGACADSSLYRRMRPAGLMLQRMVPQLAVLTAPFSYYRTFALTTFKRLTGQQRDMTQRLARAPHVW